MPPYSLNVSYLPPPNSIKSEVSKELNSFAKPSAKEADLTSTCEPDFSLISEAFIPLSTAVSEPSIMPLRSKFDTVSKLCPIKAIAAAVGSSVLFWTVLISLFASFVPPP